MFRRSIVCATVCVGVALGGAASCGGSVKVDSGDEGGGGTGAFGAGGATTGTGATGATGAAGGNPTTTTGGGGSSSLCQDYCEALVGCGASPDPNCIAECVESSSGECGPAWIEAASCLAKVGFVVGKCDPTPCAELLDAWSDCVDGGCIDEQLCWVGPNTTCGCSTDCGGSSFETSCQLSPNGPFECDCFIEGNVIGTCQDFEPATVCDVQLGCCAQIFFGEPG